MREIRITVVVSLGPKTTSMTNLVGSEYRSAETSLTRQNIEYIENFDNSETVEKDMIIRTDPAAGAELKTGDKVVLVISLGKKPKNVKVPDLTGKTEEQAREDLKPFNLTLGNRHAGRQQTA